ncbi:298_t:CDS:2, partial [Entrophospora sp. SA101]
IDTLLLGNSVNDSTDLVVRLASKGRIVIVIVIGIRISSVTYIKNIVMDLKKIQAPWNVNTSALTFLYNALKDQTYMKNTWKLTPKWRLELIENSLVAVVKKLINNNNKQNNLMTVTFYGNSMYANNRN